MAHAIMRGFPSRAQMYLEEVIQELIMETGREEDRYCVGRIVFKCLRDNPHRIAITDGWKETSTTNHGLVQEAVKVARSVTSHGCEIGDVAMLVGWNHLEYAAAYFGSLFAGLTLFMVETLLTIHELRYYLQLTKPKVIFVDAGKAEDMTKAVKEEHMDSIVVVFHGNDTQDLTFNRFTQDQSNDFHDYWPAELDKDAIAMLFTTGGSTGLGPPKVAPLTHSGIIAQAPTEWTFSTKFPQPTDLMMLQFNGQWLVHTKIMITCLLYGVPMLTQSKQPRADTDVFLLRKYKPTRVIIGPSDLNHILHLSDYQRGDLHSLQTIALVGLTPYQDFIKKLKKEVNVNANICNRYGMTEAHGYVCLGDGSRLPNVGQVINIFEYKLVDSDGNAVPPNNKGELYLRSQYCLAKTYYGDVEAAKDMYTEDGWFKTGDVLMEDERGDMRYVDRLRFLVYNEEYPISPQELEEIICLVDGVDIAIVCPTNAGPAALVVLRKDATVTRQQIHDMFTGKLSDYKRLTGGIAFVTSLPRTHVGKIHRRKCIEIVKELILKKECY